MARGLELLAPARNADTAREAILHGADAVYIGGPSHGARAAASNSLDDIAAVVDMAHRYYARVYVTLNTIIYDNEVMVVEQTVNDLYRIGVDALIVQDMSLLRMHTRPIDLHASTQCDIRTVDKARMLARCGFSQLVLPRECTLDEIRAYHRALGDDVALEAFVHGALCVSYSGDCQASYAACGRSANRGECAQMCRLPYTLVDDSGHELLRDKHLLSLRDLCRLHDLKELVDAGVTSFKIEGRLKGPEYVKTVVTAYSRALDRIIADNPGKYRRTSMGRSEVTFDPDVNDAFNRGFTSYFLKPERAATQKMASFDTPKWVGKEVGTVTASRPGVITAKLQTSLNNGDGLGYFDSAGRYCGFRLNRIEGNRLYPATKLSLTPGTILYRNSDTKLDAMLAAKTATRTIDIDMRLEMLARPDGIATVTLTVNDDHGHLVSSAAEVVSIAARTPQTEARLKTLSRTGDTIYTLRHLTDRVPADAFIPASALAELRRRAIDLLDRDVRATYPYRYHRAEDPAARTPATLTYHDNVANSLAADHYRAHGTRQIAPAIETRPAADIASGTRVMTTRYCLRRELGACLRTPDGARLPANLYLKNKNTTYRLAFDCANCRMHLLTSGNQSGR